MGEKKITEVEKWRDDKLEEQEKQPLSEMPKLTVSLIKSKIQDLDSEVQLLIGKARMIRAERERAKRKAEEEKKKEEEKAKKNLKNPTQQSLQYQVMKTQLHPKIQQKRNQKQTHQILLKRKVRKRIA